RRPSWTCAPPSARAAWPSRASSPSATRRSRAVCSARSSSTICAASSCSWSRGRVTPSPPSPASRRSTPRSSACAPPVTRRETARVSWRTASPCPAPKPMPGSFAETQLRSLGLVDHGHAELARLLELRARVLARQEIVGLLRDRAAHLGAGGFEPLLPGRARLVERPGDHKRLAGQPVAVRVRLRGPALDAQHAAPPSHPAALLRA